MTVSARAARNVAEPAKLAAMRADGAVLGGSHVYEGDRLVTGWHWHDVHQIEYAVRGVVEVETAAGHYLVPPHQAAWIPQGLEHQTTISSAVRTISVHFDRSLVPAAGDRVRILAVPPLIREMMIYALRWPIDRAGSDEVADGFFRTLAHLVTDALDDEAPLCLPTSQDPLVTAAIAYTDDHLADVTMADVSRALRVSERTLRRRFQDALPLSWRGYLLQARILRAMTLLAASEMSVLEVSLAVGFDNVGAFARAFVRHCGQTPSAYRREVRTVVG